MFRFIQFERFGLAWQVGKTMTERLQSGFSLSGLLAEAIPATWRAAVREPAAPRDEDEKWMRRALAVAMQGVGLSSPNPTVGCVIVKDGKEISHGHTLAWGDMHAERFALSKLSSPDLARGATLYVTLEPCAHSGRQPPCTDALIAAGIKRCVVGTGDAYHLVAGRGLKRLQEAGIEVVEGVLRQETRAWHFPFFLRHALGRVVLAAKWAQTLDGFFADDEGASQWLSAEPARAYGHFLRARYDAVMVGAGTVLADAPTLTARDAAIVHRQPLKIVFDPSGRLAQCDAQTRAKLARTTFAKDAQVIVIAPQEVESWVTQLPAACEFLTLPDPRRLSRVVQALGERDWFGRPLQSVMVEGGPRLLSSLLAEDLVDVIHAVIVPAFLLGERHGIGGKEARMAAIRRFQPVSNEVLGRDSLIELMAMSRAQTLFQ